MACNAFLLAGRLYRLSERVSELGIRLEYKDVPDPRHQAGLPQPIYTNDPKQGRVVGQMSEPSIPHIKVMDIPRTCRSIETLYRTQPEINELFPVITEVLLMLYYLDKGYSDGLRRTPYLTTDWWALNIDHALILACIVMSIPAERHARELMLAAHHVLTKVLTSISYQAEHQKLIDEVFELTK